MLSEEPKKSFPWKGHLLMMACKESFFITVPLEWVFSSDVAIQARRLWKNLKKLFGITDFHLWGKRKNSQAQ